MMLKQVIGVLVMALPTKVRKVTSAAAPRHTFEFLFQLTPAPTLNHYPKLSSGSRLLNRKVKKDAMLSLDDEGLVISPAPRSRHRYWEGPSA